MMNEIKVEVTELFECAGCHELVTETHQPQGSLQEYCWTCFEIEVEGM
jgi:formylmethanofuran dehydrogenase subunit E